MISLPINLWVDDERPAPEGWLWVTTYEAAIHVLENNSVNEISLDHDLGTEKTGYDIAQWLERKAFECSPDHTPPVNMIRVHSANPVGYENIKRCIENYYRYVSLYPKD